MSPRWVSYLLCLLGLPVYLWGMEGQHRVGALPPEVAVRDLRFPVRIEGVSTSTPDHLRSLMEHYAPGRRVTIESAGIRHTVTVAPAFSEAHHVINMISAIFFWMVCFFVFAGWPERDPGRTFFLSTFFYGLAISVGTIAYPATVSGVDALRPLVRSFCMALLPVLFLQMSLLFPRRRPSVDARPWILTSLLVAGLALAAVHSWVMLRYFRAPFTRQWDAFVVWDRVMVLFLVTLVAAGCLLMFQSGRRAELTRERQQLKWLWWGITVGITPHVFLYALPHTLFGREIMPLHLTRVFALAVPVAFAFAAIKHRLLDIDVIIRRSLIYGVMAGILAAVYFFLADLVGGWIASRIPESRPYVPISAAAISVMLFPPTRRLVGGWVDRTFFHIRHSYEEALRRFRASIAKPRAQEDTTRYLRRFVHRMLAPKAVVVVVRLGQELSIAGKLDPAVARRAMDHFGAAVSPRDEIVTMPNATSVPEVESDGFPRELSDHGFILVQPMVSFGTLHGLLLLGEKKTERRYIDDDMALLAGMASAASAALERLRLAQRVSEERLVREQLDQINRMKTDFFSRVAHDLRAPLTSIDWSARNLLDGLAGPMSESQTTYTQAILVSAIQLGRLVANLLEISRLEQHDGRPELEPVSLATVTDEAITGLGPIAAAKGVRFDRRIEDLGPVSGNHKQLVQVLVNLVENAVRYSPPGTVVEITLERLDGGSQRLAVRDRGPGVAPEEEAAIFERYRQGKPSPHSPSAGFGLGLYVVKSHVESFAGSVRAGNHPAGGAEFVVCLPEWPDARA